MRHYKKSGMKLGTDASHTKAMKKSLVCALLANDRIKTNVQRAKAIRPDVDKVITWAKKGDLHSRRLAIKKVGDAELVREVFEKAAQGMWADRNGGYTRIMRLGTRKGDNAEVVIIEMVNEAVTPKKSSKAKTEVKAVKKADKKAEEKAEEAAEEKAEEAAEVEAPAEETAEAEAPAEETAEAEAPAEEKAEEAEAPAEEAPAEEKAE